METADHQGSIPLAIFWMAVLSLLLLWLPAFGPLIAGVVGGKVAGGVLRGQAAVLLPAVLLAGVLFVLAASLTGMPVIGALAGAGAFVLILVQVAPLLVGALIGGLLA